MFVKHRHPNVCIPQYVEGVGRMRFALLEVNKWGIYQSWKMLAIKKAWFINLKYIRYIY